VLANDTGSKKTKMDSDFENFEDDDAIAAALAFRLSKNPTEKATSSFIFVYKQTSSAIVCSD